jgi:hypothetical protein
MKLDYNSLLLMKELQSYKRKLLIKLLIKHVSNVLRTLLPKHKTPGCSKYHYILAFVSVYFFLTMYYRCLRTIKN